MELFIGRNELTDEAEDDGAYEKEGDGDRDVADEDLTFSAARPAIAERVEGSTGRPAAEFRVAHRPSSLCSRGLVFSLCWATFMPARSVG